MNNRKNDSSLGIILLGAGQSKRFGESKLLIDVQGRPMYMHIVEKISKIPARKKVFVTRHKEIEADLKDTDISVIMNDHSDWGISYSIELGIASMDDQTDAYLFAVCDQPQLTLNSIQRLIQEYHKSDKGIACLSDGKKAGNPVVFDSKYAEELKALTGDVGGKVLVNRYPLDVLLVQADNTIELNDIDTKDQLPKK